MESRVLLGVDVRTAPRVWCADHPLATHTVMVDARQLHWPVSRHNDAAPWNFLGTLSTTPDECPSSVCFVSRSLLLHVLFCCFLPFVSRLLDASFAGTATSIDGSEGHKTAKCVAGESRPIAVACGSALRSVTLPSTEGLMTGKMRSFASALLVVMAIAVVGVEMSTCTGSDPCYACKNCKYCKHCAKDGGTCGVCKRQA